MQIRLVPTQGRRLRFCEAAIFEDRVAYDPTAESDGSLEVIKGLSPTVLRCIAIIISDEQTYLEHYADRTDCHIRAIAG